MTHEEVNGRGVYKIIYVEEDEIIDLIPYNIVVETDYGTREIIGDSIDYALSQCGDDTAAYDNILGLLELHLGKETVEKLRNYEIDFALIV